MDKQPARVVITVGAVTGLVGVKAGAIYDEQTLMHTVIGGGAVEV